MLKIGVTGGIGSGKSYVCCILREMGMAVYDCDTEAKRIMQSSSTVIQALKELVGSQVYTADGKLDKQVMAKYLFSSKAHGDAVSRIVHPAVGRDFEAFVANQTSSACIMESAILIESGLAHLVDKMVCVQAPLEVRIQRVRLRDGATEENVRKRVMCQMTEEDQKKYSFDYVILNDGRTDVSLQIRRMLSEFKLF